MALAFNPWKALLLTASVVLLIACGRGKPSAEAPQSLPTRLFPQVEAPTMFADGPMERACYCAEHYWDTYFSNIHRYRSDSLFVGGVERIPLEQAFGIYATLLWNVPLETATASMSRLYDQLAAAKDPAATDTFVEWVSRYFYDPNSPVRCEDMYLPFVEKLAEGDLIPEEQRISRQFEARMCSMNRMGTPAADFPFTDVQGRVRTLYGIQADYILLIFGNPDCHACKVLVSDMESDPDITDLTRSGRLKIVDIYIDREVETWKAHTADYPKIWINGYDHKFQIRDDLLYHVRAVPSMYLLDKDKKILLKDAPEELILSFLTQLAS